MSCGSPGGLRERLDDGLLESSPQGLQAPGNRRLCPSEGAECLGWRERIGPTGVVTGAFHDRENLVGHGVTADSAEGSGKPSGGGCALTPKLVH